MRAHTMENIFKPLLFFVYLTISYAATDSLQNPDFETPPKNLSSNNATSQKWFLNGANPLPGWSLNGTVWYIASVFPDNGGHAVQLGKNGKLNQTFKATKNDVLEYVLSFTLAAESMKCATNRTALNVTLRDGWRNNVSRVVKLLDNSSRNLWERHALFLGQLGGGKEYGYVHIEIESVATTSIDNMTCWPIVDAFTITRNELPRWYNGNMLTNGGFEVGPAFMKNSSTGIILQQEEEDTFGNQSPLQQWSVLGTIRYIDSSHYKVPRGKAAVELLSGGVMEESIILRTTNAYTLNFTLGDANNSCVADFVVYVQAGSSLHNYTMRSNGRGSTSKHTLRFRVDDDPITLWDPSTISFYSFEETRTKDGVLCGPVLDDIYLYGSGSGSDSNSNSHGEMVRVCNGALVVSLVFAFVIMVIIVQG